MSTSFYRIFLIVIDLKIVSNKIQGWFTENLLQLKLWYGSHFSYIKKRYYMNGNVTSDDEDGDALKSNCDVDENTWRPSF